MRALAGGDAARNEALPTASGDADATLPRPSGAAERARVRTTGHLFSRRKIPRSAGHGKPLLYLTAHGRGALAAHLAALPRGRAHVPPIRSDLGGYRPIRDIEDLSNTTSRIRRQAGRGRRGGLRGGLTRRSSPRAIRSGSRSSSGLGRGIWIRRVRSRTSSGHRHPFPRFKERRSRLECPRRRYGLAGDMRSGEVCDSMKPSQRTAKVVGTPLPYPRLIRCCTRSLRRPWCSGPRTIGGAPEYGRSTRISSPARGSSALPCCCHMAPLANRRSDRRRVSAFLC